MTTSYLQTLARNEAIAFAASLQKVQTHLSHELAWLSQQVQQKAVQLQGLETLLAEAEALSWVETTKASVVPVGTAASHSEVTRDTPTPSIAAAVTPRRQGKRGAQSAAPKNNAAPAVPAKPIVSRKASQPAKGSTQAFVRSQYQDQSLTDAVGDILERSRSPLDADAIMAALYEGLSDEAYRRAKNSVTNILSVGRVKGKWQSTGRGLYANNAVAIR